MQTVFGTGPGVSNLFIYLPATCPSFFCSPSFVHIWPYSLKDELLIIQIVHPGARDLKALRIKTLEEQLNRRFCCTLDANQLLELI
jgi:hypothetical protein